MKRWVEKDYWEYRTKCRPQIILHTCLPQTDFVTTTMKTTKTVLLVFLLSS